MRDQRALTRRLAGPLWALGIAGIVVGLSKAHAVGAGYDWTGSSRFGWAMGFIAVLWVVGYAFGVPGSPARGRLVTAVLAAFVGVLGISLAQIFLGAAYLPRAVVFGTGLLAIPWNVFCEWLATGGGGGARVLFVGDIEDPAKIGDDLASNSEQQASIVGACSVADLRPGPDDRAPLMNAVRETRATLLVLGRDAQDDEPVLNQVVALHEAGIRVRTLLTFSEEWLGKLPVSDLETMSVLFDINEIHGAGYARTKRLLDLVLGACAMVALVVAIPFVFVGNLVANRGPLFYRQQRVGRAGTTFDMVKFRSMRDGDSTQWTAADDDRITAFGRVLRVTHLDELPQAWNVLKGEIAIVGPRPEQPVYVDELREKIPFYDVRHLVRPGMTGWAQVKYPYGADDADALEKLQYEMWYLRHQSLPVDARIMVRTLRHIVGFGGR